MYGIVITCPIKMTDDLDVVNYSKTRCVWVISIFDNKPEVGKYDIHGVVVFFCLYK